MKDPDPTLAEKSKAPPVSPRRKLTLDLPPALIVSALGLVVGFAWPLYHCLRFGLESELYSYTLLVPIVSAYLFVQNRKSISTSDSSSFRTVGATLMVLGLAALGCYWWGKITNGNFVPQDAAAFTILPFVLILAGACAWGLKSGEFQQATFPLAFLVFMVPLPSAAEHAVETFLQHGSAPPALWFFNLIGTTVYRNNLVFELPGMALQIAPECSGIRSTLVLFMTSLLAGYLFLRSPWKRVVLTLIVVPLALLRNGFRVFVIGQLCVSVGPHMIDSPIHHNGGPIFFALSLLPFFALLFFLVKSDRKTPSSTKKTS